MKRHGPAIFLLIATLSGGLSAHAATDRAELNRIHKQISHLREQHQTTENNRNQAADALRQSELAISTTNRSLYELQQRSDQTEASLRALNARIGTVRQSISQQKTRLAALLRQSYFDSQANDAHLLLDGAPAGQTARDLVYSGYLGRERNRMIADLRHNADTLNQLKARQQQLQADLDSQRSERERERQALQDERQRRQRVLASLGTQIRQQEQQLATLEENEKRITRLMEQLARQRRHPRPARHAREPAAGTPVTPLPQPDLPATGLGLLKGRLPMPTHGELIHRFGTPREAGGTLWKGLFIKAPAGQSVVSVAAGQVVFADWLRGFGNLIIIDHGGGYMSLYSDNETLYKRVGDFVKSGEVIAAVGNTGGSNETGLYFELRYRSQAFDPDPWLVRQ